MTVDVSELRALHEAATRGPWLVDPLSAWITIPVADAPICAMLWPTELRSEDETFDNARLIVAMRNALPTLLAEHEAMRKALEPFAKYADGIGQFTGSVDPMFMEFTLHRVGTRRVTEEDFRAARQALSPSKDTQDHE